MPSDTWYCIPSANHEKCTATFAGWKAMGYMTAVLIDGDAPAPGNADIIVRQSPWLGYAASTNLLMAHPAIRDADFCIAGGDDLKNDPHKLASEIAAECIEHFKGTLGVMQPTGHAFGALVNMRQRAAVSAWIGREFRRRVNGGLGPFWTEYKFNYDDTELAHVAELNRCMWWRPDITQYHDHRSLNGAPDPDYITSKAQDIANSRTLFKARKAAGFPGSEFIP